MFFLMRRVLSDEKNAAVFALRSVGADLDVHKTGLRETGAKCLWFVDIFDVLLAGALPETAAPREEIHPIAERLLALVEIGAPETETVFVLVDGSRAVERAQALWRVYVENKNSIRIEKKVKPPQQLRQIAGRQLVDGVETGHGGVDRAVEVELRHGLAQKQRWDDVRQLREFLLREHKHIR